MAKRNLENIQSSYRQNQYDETDKEPCVLLPEVVYRDYKIGIGAIHSKKNGAKPVEFPPN
jgi:hypothetical protein